MIKQAHTYFVGAFSGVTLIAIAIGVFVVLVSAQVFHELPIVNISSPDQQPPAVAPAKALPAGSGATTATSTRATPKASGARNAAAAPAAGHAVRHRAATDPGKTTAVAGPATAVESSPAATGDGTTSSSGNSGSNSSQPSSKSPSPSPSSSQSGSNSPGPSANSGSSGSSGSSGGATGSSGSSGGSGGGTTTAPVTAGVKSTSETVTGAANGTVGAVNEATGGTLEKTGVTEVTEKAVESVAGPESVVGKTVNGATETLNGLLGAGSP